jgi:4-amino-4-deoxy-L-arabinose transferase-like glycosyltransferase
VLYLLANFHIQKDLPGVISDFLAVLCLTLASLMLATAFRHPGRTAAWIGAGSALGLAALTKAIFLPFAFGLAGLLAVVGMVGLRKLGLIALLPAVIVSVLAVAPGVGWAVRNTAVFGVPDDGRSGVALSTREVFDHMTPAEHAAAYLMWMRGPGPMLAKQFFSPQLLSRFDYVNPDGFYVLGQFTNPEARISKLMAEDHLGFPAATRASLVVVAREIWTDLPGYLLSMPALVFRGLFVDDYIVIGFPALVWVLWRAGTGRDWPRLAALAPGLWSLAVYPAVSLNITRYQETALPTLAFGAALLVGDWLNRTNSGQPT